jgi:hypothetical protein
MTEKWADYLISAVKYNSADTHIVKVKAHSDDGDKVGVGSEVLRENVVSLLDSGTTFCTITKSSDGKWSKGAPVYVIVIDDVKYIKTVADSTKQDNLGSLPHI